MNAPQRLEIRITDLLLIVVIALQIWVGLEIRALRNEVSTIQIRVP